MKTRLLVVLGLVLVCLIWARPCTGAEDGGSESATSSQEEPDWLKSDGEDSEGGPRTDKNLTRQFIMGVGFVALLGGAAYFLSKKVKPGLTTGRGKHMAVVETLSLGTQRSLCLVEVGQGRKLLLGVSPSGIQLVSDVSDSVEREPMDSMEITT